MTDVRCKHCQAVIDAANVDWQRELASCTNCGSLTDLRRTKAPQAGGTARARTRVPTGLPAGMSVDAGATVVIRRRWLRAKHWFLLLVFGGMGAFVAYLWNTSGPSVGLVIGTIFVSVWNYAVLGAFVNTTVVTGDAQGVTVKHGPLPSLFGRNASVEKANVEQLYSASFGRLFAVHVKLKSGRIQRLVAPLVTAEQALFVEQELERVLGITDVPVPGELGNEQGKSAEVALVTQGDLSLQGRNPAGAFTGKVVAIFVPVMIAGSIGLFAWAANTEVSGRLTLGGSLGSGVFEPDDCSSGQREGYGGVELTSEKQFGRIVRVVKDPARGSLVVLASPGKPLLVLSRDQCTRFDVSVERTNTSINEIWAIDGSVNVECTGLTGSLTFEGCH